MENLTLTAPLQDAARILDQWAVELTTPEPNRLDVRLPASDLLAAAKAMVTARWGYLAAITGLDLGGDSGELELLYHFCSGASILTLRVSVPYGNAFVPSLYEIIPSVSFYERELIEMLGITVANTPNTDRLFLPDDWPDGVYPLRKDFNIEDAHTPRSRNAHGHA